MIVMNVQDTLARLMTATNYYQQKKVNTYAIGLRLSESMTGMPTFARCCFVNQAIHRSLRPTSSTRFTLYRSCITE